MYRKSGYMSSGAGEMVALIILVGISVLVLIFVSVLGGQTYQLTESKITAINDTEVKQNVVDSAKGGFLALKQTSDYLPLIVLAVIIGIVLTIVLNFTQFGGGYTGKAL